MLKKEKIKKREETKIALKLILCLVYIIAITVLVFCSYKIFKDKDNVTPWSDVTDVEQYSYIEVSKMSEKFAYYTTNKKSIHFVIEKEATGVWHTYIIAIKDSDYNKFKDIIDYTYERTDKEPVPVKVYGYPVIINDELKKSAINNIKNFVPVENEVIINNDNFEQYLTNCYLDTTIDKKDKFSVPLFTLLLLILILLSLFILTIFDRKKIVKDIDYFIDDIKIKHKK